LCKVRPLAKFMFKKLAYAGICSSLWIARCAKWRAFRASKHIFVPPNDWVHLSPNDPYVLGWNCSLKRTTRAVSAALHTPHWGGTLSQGAQNSSPSPLSTREKASIPELEYEALETSEVRGHFERKVHCSCFGPLWKQGIFTLQLLGTLLKAKQPNYTLQFLLGPIWKQGRLLCTLQLQRGPEASASLPFP